MKLNLWKILSLVLVIISVLAGIFLYDKMPEQMASHWNAQGIVDGHISRFWGLFLMPLITLGLFLVLVFLPRLDPLKANVEKFRSYYEKFIFLFTLFMVYVHALTLLWNLSFKFELLVMLSPAFAMLLFYLGVLISKSERNWFIGIRTPWTLSSDKVWNKTHHLGGILFKISGLIALLGLIYPNWALESILIPIVLSVIITLFYSYYVYHEEKHPFGKKV